MGFKIFYEKSAIESIFGFEPSLVPYTRKIFFFFIFIKMIMYTALSIKGLSTFGDAASW